MERSEVARAAAQVDAVTTPSLVPSINRSLATATNINRFYTFDVVMVIRTIVRIHYMTVFLTFQRFYRPKCFLADSSYKPDGNVRVNTVGNEMKTALVRNSAAKQNFEGNTEIKNSLKKRSKMLNKKSVESFSGEVTSRKSLKSSLRTNKRDKRPKAVSFGKLSYKAHASRASKIAKNLKSNGLSISQNAKEHKNVTGSSVSKKTATTIKTVHDIASSRSESRASRKSTGSGNLSGDDVSELVELFEVPTFQNSFTLSKTVPNKESEFSKIVDLCRENLKSGAGKKVKFGVSVFPFESDENYTSGREVSSAIHDDVDSGRNMVLVKPKPTRTGRSIYGSEREVETAVDVEVIDTTSDLHLRRTRINDSGSGGFERLSVSNDSTGRKPESEESLLTDEREVEAPDDVEIIDATTINRRNAGNGTAGNGRFERSSYANNLGRKPLGSRIGRSMNVSGRETEMPEDVVAFDATSTEDVRASSPAITRRTFDRPDSNAQNHGSPIIVMSSRKVAKSKSPLVKSHETTITKHSMINSPIKPRGVKDKVYKEIARKKINVPAMIKTVN